MMTSNNIPKMIHFIWLGNKEIPTHYIDRWKSMYIDFEVRIWTDKSIIDHIIPEKLKPYYYMDFNTPVLKADILRYCLLNYFGGLYVDIDFEPLRKLPYPFLQFEFLGGIQNNKEVAIGFIGSNKNNELLQDVIDNIPHSIDKAIKEDYFYNWNLHKITGPEFFTTIASKYYISYNYFFFQPEYFYPYWHDEKIDKNINFKEKYPLAYGVHHWNMSWTIQ